MSLLKDEAIKDQAKQILDYLPTSPVTRLKIEQISRRRTFDYSEFLPLHYPKIFQYNFESIVESFSPKLAVNFERTGGFLYLVKAIPHCPDLSLDIVSFLDTKMPPETKTALSAVIYETFFPCLSSFNEDDFKVIAIFLRQFQPTSISQEVAEDAMHVLLLSESHTVRSLSGFLFGKLLIPMDSFTKLIPFVSETCATEFYIAFAEHIEKPCPELVLQIRAGWERQVIGLPALLQVLLKLLERKFVPDEDCEFFTHCFISRFLYIDSRNKERAIFEHVVLCLNHMQNDTLLNHLTLLNKRLSNYADWGMDGDSVPVSLSGRSGLENLGATCFLNATLQQFYAISPLRNRIIEYDGENNFMAELRNLFCRMYVGNSEQLSPESLVRQWIGWDGEPMDPLTQQDACEFCQGLIDKLEDGLGQSFVHDLFGGTIVHKIQGRTVEYSAVRLEPFSIFPLPIVDASCAEKAFAKTGEPDFLTGRNQITAEGIGKIDAEQRSLLGTLPKHLILHLTRFQYNYVEGYRTKLNKHFEFPPVLDVRPYTAGTDTTTDYELTGVTVHTGTADFGHYTSFVRIADQWLDFDDTRVSAIDEADVLRVGYGEGTTSGYVLFYTRGDIVGEAVPEPRIAESLLTKFAEEIRLNDEYRLFCSHPYFTLMTLLADSKDWRFVDIAMKYYFVTFPFTTHIKRAHDITAALCRQLTACPELQNALLSFIRTGSFSCALIYCPEALVRTGACKMISTIDAVKIPGDVIGRIFDEIEKVVPYYTFTQMFELLSSIVSRSPAARAYAVAASWPQRLARMLFVLIREFLDKKEVEEAVYWSEVCLTGVFHLMSHLPLSEETVEGVLRDGFLSDVLCSRTDVRAVAQLVESSPAPAVGRELVRGWAQRRGMHARYSTVTALLFLLLGDSAFAEIRSAGLRVDSRPASSYDFACAVLLHVLTCDARAFVLAAIDRFLLDLLLDESSETRLAAVHIVLAIAPHAAFAGTASLPRGKVLPADVDFDARAETADATAAAGAVLRFLLANRAPAVARIAADRATPSHCIGTQFLRLLAGLAEATRTPVTGALVGIARELVPVRRPFDETVSVCLIALLDRVGAAGEFVRAAFPPFAERVDDGAAVVQVLEVFAPHIAQLDADDALAWNFLSFVAFSGHAQVLRRFDCVCRFLEKFVRDCPQSADAFLRGHLAWSARTNFSATLAVAGFLGARMPVLPHLLPALARPQALPLSEIVRRTFAATTECDGVDAEKIAGLLNAPALDAGARACVWRWLAAHPPAPRAFLAVYRARCDEEALAEFLLGLRSADCTQRLLEAAMSDAGAFARAWPHLRGVADVFEANFARAVLALEFGEHWRAVAEYARALLGREGADAAALLRPLVGKVRARVEFVAEIADEGDAVTRADVEALVAALRVAAEVPQCKERIGHAIARLAAVLEKVRPAEEADADAVAALKTLTEQIVQ
jgi:ubiquitin C-terminal hydrolase